MKIAAPDRLQFLINMRAPQRKTGATLRGKLCVISGATSGVGLAGVRRIAQGGAHIVLVARNIQKAKDVQSILKAESGAKVDIVIADFTSFDDIKDAAKTILETNPEIHLLINSAGIFSTKKIILPNGFEMSFCVNHLAPFLFARLLLHRMIESAPARIIQVNSQGHRFRGFNINDMNWEHRLYNGYWGYGASKTAQLLTVWEFADMLKGTQVTINAMHPGGVKSNLGMNNGTIYRWYARHIISHLLADPRIAGDAIYFLAADPELNEVSGKYFNRTIEEKPDPHALNRQFSTVVWELSERLVGLATIN